MEVTPVILHEVSDSTRNSEPTESAESVSVTEELGDDYDPELIGDLIPSVNQSKVTTETRADCAEALISEQCTSRSDNNTTENQQTFSDEKSVENTHREEEKVQIPTEEDATKKLNDGTKSSPGLTFGPESQVDTPKKIPDELREFADPVITSDVLEPGIDLSATTREGGKDRQEREDEKREEEEDDDDDYDPLQLGESVAESRKEVTSLPAKPQNTSELKDAYQAIMNSDIVKRPEFLELSQEDQIKVIQQLLAEKNIALPSPTQSQIDPDMNYAQVHSFNKPFKNVKDPIPLIPTNKYCRRPDITLPLSSEEEKAYHEFLEQQELMGGNEELNFPENLRLFIGNFPANTISKQDLFRILHPYGEVVQISIKGGYAFVQFRTAEACAEFIKGETGVPLHNKFLRLAPSLRNKPATTRGRERPEMSSGGEPEAKRHHIGPECLLLVTSSAISSLVEEVEAVFKAASINFMTNNIGDKDPAEEICEAAYLGVIAACIIENNVINIQTFEETLDGGIRFDEYENIEANMAVDLIRKQVSSTSLESPQKELKVETTDLGCETKSDQSSCGHRSEQGREKYLSNFRRSDNSSRGRYNSGPRSNSRNDYQTDHYQSDYSNNSYKQDIQKPHGQNHGYRQSFRGTQRYNQGQQYGSNIRVAGYDLNSSIRQNNFSPQEFNNSSSYGLSYGTDSYGNGHGRMSYGTGNYGNPNYGNNNYANNANYGNNSYDNKPNYRNNLNYDNGFRNQSLHNNKAPPFPQPSYPNGQGMAQPGFYPVQYPGQLNQSNGTYNAARNSLQITPEVLQTLQNLDPLTLQNVMGMLQRNGSQFPVQSQGNTQSPPANFIVQQNQAHNSAPPMQSYPAPPKRNYDFIPQQSYDEYMPHHRQTHERLQLPQSRQSQHPYQPQQPQPTQQPQNSALMEMLARLGNP